MLSLDPLPRGSWARVRTIIFVSDAALLGRFRPGSSGNVFLVCILALSAVVLRGPLSGRDEPGALGIQRSGSLPSGGRFRGFVFKGSGGPKRC